VRLEHRRHVLVRWTVGERLSWTGEDLETTGMNEKVAVHVKASRAGRLVKSVGINIRQTRRAISRLALALIFLRKN
jgi:hypothetical protein